VTGLNQIAVAMAQAEIAAVDIHNRLRDTEGLCLAPLDRNDAIDARLRSSEAGGLAPPIRQPIAV